MRRNHPGATTAIAKRLRTCAASRGSPASRVRRWRGARWRRMSARRRGAARRCETERAAHWPARRRGPRRERCGRGQCPSCGRRSACASVQVRQGVDVSAGDVQDVNVVADAGAVPRRIVVAVDLQPLALAGGHLSDDRQQIRRGLQRRFAEMAARVGARRVEVAQDGNAPLRVGVVDIAQHLFGHLLAASVGVRRRQRAVLRSAASWQTRRRPSPTN